MKKGLSKKNKAIIAIVFVILIIGFGIFAWWKAKEKPKTPDEVFDSVLASFNSKDPKSFENVYQISDIGEQALPRLTSMIESNSIYERWVAIVCLSTLLRNNQDLKDQIIPELEKALDDKNDYLKMLSAAELCSFGEIKGLPVLITSLKSDEISIFSDPPSPVSLRANMHLEQYTGKDFDYEYDDKDKREDAVEGWEGWWKKNKDSLVWDGEKDLFEVK
ncbi:hypothetical protein COY23_02265 [bacterium (Candidatus Torokbacteria) CG_4_10_14_0_2_um_filter_35_8]|nr:MAG: hypothetical protein COY23_02265 [bacterium (Candidatus Torokbacteria) CG_4_10_14_0_2_um_filter_35_8]